MPHIAIGLLAAGLLMLTACKKAEAPAPTGNYWMFGVTIELSRLDHEFQNAGPELQTTISGIKMKCQRWQLPEMLADLDGLSKNPSLTEPQKKAVNDVMDQARQAFEKKNAAGQR